MADPKTILVADDEPSLRRVLGSIIQREGHRVITAADGQAALNALRKSEVHTIVTDLRMPQLDGMELLRRAIAEYPDIPVVILTAHGSVDSAVAAVKLGAFDYLEKPFEQQQIQQVIAKALRTNELRRRELRLGGTTAGNGRFGLVGTSAPMRTVYNVIEKVADTPSTVLITGESGTGKELVAKAIHEQSARRDKALIKVNCAAIPEALMESELFGHEKGAFTGAVSAKPGRFELAESGTLFLDEIGEIPLEMQVKLLRALQDGEFDRVGGIKTVKVDVRLVTATNRDLGKEVESGRFREDLFYRLNVVPIQLPPLRERRADIPLLVDHILERFRSRLGRPARALGPDALAVLATHDWPGNIRELENLLERTVLFCEHETIGAADLPPPLGGGSSERPVLVSGDSSLKEIVRAETERVERQAIVSALEETGGNVTHAAKRLKISRKSLQNKMKELGLRDPEGGGQKG